MKMTCYKATKIRLEGALDSQTELTLESVVELNTSKGAKTLKLQITTMRSRIRVEELLDSQIELTLESVVDLNTLKGARILD